MAAWTCLNDLLRSFQSCSAGLGWGQRTQRTLNRNLHALGDLRLVEFEVVERRQRPWLIQLTGLITGSEKAAWDERLRQNVACRFVTG